LLASSEDSLKTLLASKQCHEFGANVVPETGLGFFISPASSLPFVNIAQNDRLEAYPTLKYDRFP
jgi:hypothetical protein